MQRTINWQKNNKEKFRAKYRKYRYGITQQQYDKLYLDQLGLCAICHEPFGEEIPHIDHCHKTGKIRGLTHGNCNRVIGMVKEDVTKLYSGIEYLVKHSSEALKELPYVKRCIDELLIESNR